MDDFGENIDLDAIESAYNQLLKSKPSDYTESQGIANKEKVILWKHASLSIYEGVEKMTVPFFLKKRIFIISDTGRSSYEGMSFFIVSKTDGMYEFEIMTRLPDTKYQESFDAFVDFSGLIILEDIFGDFIKGYFIEEGEISGAVRKVESKISESCVTIEWNLFSENGEMSLSASPSHIEYYCPDSSILAVNKDNVYTSIGRVTGSIRERRYVNPELRLQYQLITGNPD
ncbi:hypothetical protein [Dyadobacter sp. 3J3]|uniref:hypothetical protein n=1 Tax=Dyadobacter sp. 3J3 TaxID=2606600 RepID=UPI00135C7AD9|nr:hypothetical protein [Dyadobacter sp. 3J3]